MRAVIALVLRWPVFLTDWAEVIPAKFHCGIMEKLYGVAGHSFWCPSCDDEPLEEYIAS